MTYGKVKKSGKVTKEIIFVSFLWFLQSIGRLSFAILGGPAGMRKFLDVSISYTISLLYFL
jgi:hypothetical protein